MIKLPPYVTRRKKKIGVRYYFQVPAHVRPKSWPKKPIRLKDDTVEMFQQAKTLYERLLAERGGKPKQSYVEGTFPWILQEYHKSPRYRTLAKTTQYLYDWCAKFIEEWSEKAEHPHVSELTRPDVLKFLRQFDANPTKKKKIAVFLGVLLSVAIDYGFIEYNPARELNLKEPDSNVHIWTADEVDAFIAQADRDGMPNVGTAVLIGFEIGQRQADILSLTADNFSDGCFLFTQRKTGEILKIKASEKLAKRLTGKTGLLVPNLKGERYTRTGFISVFNGVRAGCGLTACQFLHLRHSAVVGLARASCTTPEIASITGHTVASVASILRRYLPRDAEVAANAIVKRETYEAVRQAAKPQ